MTRFTGNHLYAGVMASTGSTSPRGTQSWRTITCPREDCGAGPQTKCRRRISEKYTSGKTTGLFTHEGEGRWADLKHPHPERKRRARGV